MYTKQTGTHFAVYINIKNIEIRPQTTKWMMYTAIQGLLPTVAKQRRLLPNDVIFRQKLYSGMGWYT